MRILYVEDNPANLFLVQRVARMGSHEVISYSDGQHVLDNFATDQPDLVLMDVQILGHLTGLDVVKRLRAAGHKTPIVAVTAYAMMGDRERCLEAGCDAYIAKPLPISELVEMIRRFEVKPAANTAPATPTQPPATTTEAPAAPPESSTAAPAQPPTAITETAADTSTAVPAQPPTATTETPAAAPVESSTPAPAQLSAPTTGTPAATPPEITPATPELNVEIHHSAGHESAKALSSSNGITPSTTAQSEHKIPVTD